MTKWIMMTVGAVVLLGLGIGGTLLVVGGVAGKDVMAVTTESRNSQVIESIAREEQVVLLSLGIQGISKKNSNSTFLGQSVPGSDRSKFIQYNFNAKLGIEGSEVTITQTAEDSYAVHIPEFIFLGHSDATFELIAEDNGVLSWTTPELDSVQMINEILNDDTQHAYLASNDEILKEQAEGFYQGIISGVAPDAKVTFTFAPAA